MARYKGPVYGEIAGPIVILDTRRFSLVFSTGTSTKKDPWQFKKVLVK